MVMPELLICEGKAFCVATWKSTIDIEAIREDNYDYVDYDDELLLCVGNLAVVRSSQELEKLRQKILNEYVTEYEESYLTMADEFTKVGYDRNQFYWVVNGDHRPQMKLMLGTATHVVVYLQTVEPIT